MASNLVEQIATKAATLPPERQREALMIIEQLAAQTENTKTRITRAGRKLKGATAQGQSISSDEIREAREEMWRGYMSEDEA